jgi:phenylacetic acid degradation operon negative regulatory protein
MKLKIRENSIAHYILAALDVAEEMATPLFMHPNQWNKVEMQKQYTSYRTTVYRLMETGLIEIVGAKKDKKFRLTKEGQMQMFMLKAKMPQQGPWDGKWRLILFDIPEKAEEERRKLRKLLLENNFKMLQASVYISPWALNREAVAFLKETALDKFIRIIRCDELDDDRELRKKFKLKA